MIVPTELWREIESEKESSYLWKSENMKRRLLEAEERQPGIPFDEGRRRLGISTSALSSDPLHFFPHNPPHYFLNGFTLLADILPQCLID